VPRWLLAPHCRDGVRNEDEENVDCGGACGPCPLKVLPAHCSDGVQGDGETGVDRGGPCLPEHCFTFARGDETGSNCGGSCQPCTPAASRFQNQYESLLCDLPPGPPFTYRGSTGATTTPTGGDPEVSLAAAAGAGRAGAPSVAGWAANPSVPVEVAIPRQTPARPFLHWDASCAASSHEQPGFFQFGGVAMEWAEGFMAARAASISTVTGLQADPISGDIVVVGTISGRMEQTRVRSANLDASINRPKPPDAGRAATVESTGEGSFVARYTARGERKFLTMIDPQHPRPGFRIDRLAETVASSVAVYRGADQRLRILVSGTYKKLGARFYHADPDTGRSMKGWTAWYTSTKAYVEANPNPPPPLSAEDLEDVMCPDPVRSPDVRPGNAYGETVDIVEDASKRRGSPRGSTRLLCDYVYIRPPRAVNAAASSTDGFVALYDEDGRVLWARGQVAAAATVRGTHDSDSGLHVTVDTVEHVAGLEGGSTEGLLAMSADEQQNAKMAYLGGTIQLFDKAQRQTFAFPPHTSHLQFVGLPRSNATDFEVEVESSSLETTRLAFVARMFVSDRSLGTQWVRLLGPLGRPFFAKYAVNEVQAALLPLPQVPPGMLFLGARM
jgi:hypothetical protein